MHFLFLALLFGSDAQPQKMDWQIDGTKREALVFAPTAKSAGGAPVVFAFHGHGGNMNYAAKTFAYQQHWPQAIVVYMQGLPTKTYVDPQGKLPGWQLFQGNENDRDLKFFDTVLADLKKKYAVDEKRIYATGHSNGGIFTYLLWAARPDVFAALAPSGAPAGKNLAALKPRPAFHVAGETDKIVPFTWQKKTIDAVLKLNGCDEKGKDWAKHCTFYSSSTGTPFITYIHAGGHTFPSDAPALIVKFFKEHPRAK